MANEDDESSTLEEDTIKLDDETSIAEELISELELVVSGFSETGDSQESKRKAETIAMRLVIRPFILTLQKWCTIVN